jgi:phosphate starvation-inducible protein PhoH and related proteins
MTAKSPYNFDDALYETDSIHYIEPTPIGLAKQRKQKGRKQKKKMDRSELNYYYEELKSDPLRGITRLSDIGFAVAGTQLREEPMNRKFSSDSTNNPRFTKDYYENIENLSAKEKHRFEQNFTIPKNLHQAEYVAALKNKHKKIVVCTGPAGTGKTLFATEYGVRQFLTGQIEKLIFTRPSVSVDEDLGYLPGTLEDKMAPWIRPIYDILYTFLSPAEVTALIEDKAIEIAPLGYMRGRTFKNAWIVADEMQNSTISQMKMLLTRLGENSRIIVTGDLEQFDRVDKVNNVDALNGLDDFLSKLRGKRSDSISSFEFDREDIQREEVVREVLEIYAAYEIPNSYAISLSDDSSSSL